MENSGIIDELISKKYITTTHMAESAIWPELKKIADNLNISKPRQILHHYKHNIVEVPTCKCGGLLPWHDDKREYRKYCSKSCTAKYSVDDKKKHNLETLGVEWHSQLDSWKEKVEDTNSVKYGKKYYSQTDECKSRVQDTNIKNLGVAHPAQHQSVMDKTVATNQEKYGHDYVLQSDSIKEKIKNTIMDVYGVDNIAKSPLIRERIKQTILDRYGVDHQNKNKQIVERSLETRYNNKYSDLQKSQLEDIEWLKTTNKSGLTLHEIAGIIGVSSSKIGTHFKTNDLDVIRHSKSAYERFISEYFSQLNINVLTNNRNILNGREIDIFFPDHNFGVELNGIYWHSEQFNKSKNFHLSKSLLAKEKNITLFHFWDYELDNSMPIVISKISHKLGLSKQIPARKCSIKILTLEEKREFFNNNHIQGDCKSSINLGLVDRDGRIVMSASFGKSRFNKSIQWELIRLTSLNGHTVVGGASKLWKAFKRTLQQGDCVITYGNRRFGDATVYNNFGFEFSHYAEPGYFYTKAGKYMGSRNAWQKRHLKDKLDLFDLTKTESENMAQNGYYRVWDCGNTVHTYVHSI